MKVLFICLLISTTAMADKIDQDSYQYKAWNLAYSKAADVEDLDSKWELIHEAIELLRKEAIAKEPFNFKNYKELMWILLHRFDSINGEDKKKYFRKKYAAVYKNSSKFTLKKKGYRTKTLNTLEEKYKIKYVHFIYPEVQALYWCEVVKELKGKLKLPENEFARIENEIYEKLLYFIDSKNNTLKLNHNFAKPFVVRKVESFKEFFDDPNVTLEEKRRVYFSCLDDFNFLFKLLIKMDEIPTQQEIVKYINKNFKEPREGKISKKE